MRQATLWGTVAVMAAANAMALIHAVRNRAGEPEAEITLTNKAWYGHSTKDDSGVELALRMTTRWGPEGELPWFGTEKLRELGFDVSVPVGSNDAWRHYARQRARSGYAAIEAAEDGSGMRAIDAGLDAAALRARHPDRRRVAIVHAIFRAAYQGPWTATAERPARAARIEGYIMDWPSRLHVPLPYSAALRPVLGESGSDRLACRVRVRYGHLLEPQVAGVEVMR